MQVLQNQCCNKNVLDKSLLVKRFYETERSKLTNKGFIETVKNVCLNSKEENIPSSILPVAVIDLNPLSNNSAKLLLIPLNWQDADEHSLRNTITSIFSKPKTLQKIEAFSRALKEAPAYKIDKDLEEGKVKDKNLENKKLKAISKETLSKDTDDIPKSLVEDAVINSDSLDRLAAAVDKTLQQCCLNSMQIFADNNILGVKIKGLKFPPVLPLTDKAHLSETFTPPSSLNIDMSKVNLKDISWHQKNPYNDIPNSSLSNVILPITLNKKAFSTKSRAEENVQDSKIQSAMTKTQSPKIVTLTICRKASSSSSRVKCIANYDFPYLAKLFGTKELLMSCDAYNQALIEAAKRRAALTECAAKSKEMQSNSYKRPQVTSIKVCSDPIKDFKGSASCPPPSKPIQQASGGCKKDDPCKPPECPNPCKDKLEKLERLKDQEIKKNRNKMPTGCESPKCKKDDKCKNSTKSPCKKASNQKVNEGIKSSPRQPSIEKQMSGDCKKDDPCKPPQCSNPCKDEMEKLKRQTDGEMKRKQSKIPTGCISPKCKKEDACIKRKENPCKKASDKDPQGLTDSQSSLKCSNKGGVDAKGKSDSCGSAKDKKQKNPCLDEHTEYKPKCNIDPCKKDGNPCGVAKKAPSGNSDKKKADSCSGCGKKEDSSKKKNEPCGSKNKDPCKKEKSSPCGKRKEDPCRKKREDPCKKKKDDSCKKEKQDPCKKEKEDPCKKKNPCKKEKEDPCQKKKEYPCKKKKEDPCKKKSPCGGQKEDPCKKEKEDPCKKKKSSPCVSDKKRDDSCSKKTTSPCKSKKDTKSKQTCGKSKASTKPNCGKDKKCYSTLTTILSNTSGDSLIKRTFTGLSALRFYSSKKGGSKKKSEDLGRSSQCKTVATTVPPKRKPAYNPHPKDGLRTCYPTYDMDCTKFCKDARKTDCRKYAFLKDTDNNKRNGKFLVFV